MPTRDEYRELAEVYRRLAERESDPHLKRLLEGHARALAQLAAARRREEAGAVPSE